MVAALALLLFLGRLYLSEADFGLENPSWNGISGLSAAKPLYDVSGLSGAGTSDTFLIMSPQRNFTTDESAKVAAFMQAGGKVVVMDDFGDASSLLSSIGSPIAIDQVPLRDYNNYYVNRSLPIVKSFNPLKETANVSQLVFNHPASLTLSSGAYPLAYTSDTAWRDYDDNGRLDGNEKMGSYCMIARADYGNGELLVISDPDLFINSMASLGDNKVLQSNVLTGAVWVDVSHGRDVTPAGAVYYALKNDSLVQMAIVLLAFAGGLAYVKRGDIIALIRRKILRV